MLRGENFVSQVLDRSLASVTEWFKNGGSKVHSTIRRFAWAGTFSLLVHCLVLLNFAHAQSGLGQGVGADKVITLGTWLPRSGPLAGVGSFGMDGANFAFKRFNAAGGVNGYTIKLIEIDDGYDPGRSVAAIRKLWTDDKVFAMFFPYGSPSMQATKQFALANKVPLLFPFGSAHIYHENLASQPSHVYGFYPHYDEIVYSVVEYALKNRKAKRIGIVYNQGEFGQAGIGALEKAAKKYGFEVGSRINYPLNETNFVSIGRRVAASSDDATLVWSVVGGVQIIAAAEQAGYKGDWLIQTALVGKSAEAEYAKIPTLAKRMFLPHFQKMPNDRDSEIESFVRDFQNEYPDSDVNIALIGYTNARVFITALTKASQNGANVTWNAFQKALESIDGESIAASPRVSYADAKIGNAHGRIYDWDGRSWQPVTDFSQLPKR